MPRKTRPIDKVVILGVPFEIRYEERKAAKGGDLGEVDSDDRIIRVDSSQAKDDLEATTLHEVLHAILHISGMVHLLPNGKLEEGIVRALEAGLRPLVTFRKDAITPWNTIQTPPK